MKFSGKVFSVEVKETIKEDVEIERASIKFRNGDGIKISLEGDKDLSTGFYPGQEWIAEFKLANQRLVDE